MSRTPRVRSYALLGVWLILVAGCAADQSQAPLSYIALARPTGAIKATGQRITTEHSRGGFYFLNAGYRPAADIGAYIEKAQADAGTEVLQNADVQLKVPFVIDILLFGFQVGSDTVTAN